MQDFFFLQRPICSHFRFKFQGHVMTRTENAEKKLRFLKNRENFVIKILREKSFCQKWNERAHSRTGKTFLFFLILKPYLIERYGKSSAISSREY